LTHGRLTIHTMPFHPQYNVNWELAECLELVYEILDFLDDIKLALELEEDITALLNPPFDPFKTIGKY
jgi:hypothetical protein